MVTPRGISDGEAKVKVAHQIAVAEQALGCFSVLLVHARERRLQPLPHVVRRVWQRLEPSLTLVAGNHC